MTPSLSEIHARVRAADRALAMVRGGSSELAYVREAVGSLLVAVHALAGLLEQHPQAAAGSGGEAQGTAVPAQRRRKP